MFYKRNLINTVILAFLTYRFIDSFFWYHPFNVSNDSNTHWAYLAATTFDFIDPKWDFPKFIYGPWYYFITSYIFGPFFFFIYYLDIISVREAAMYSFMCINFTLSIVLFLGTLKISKKLFQNSLGRNSYLLLVMLLPFTNKSYYNFTVENLSLAFMPWIIYYLIKITKISNLKNWIKLSVLLGLSASSKVSFLVPNLIFISGFFLIYGIKKKQISLYFTLPYIFTFFMVLSSNYITNASLFDNLDAGNAERNYPGLENNEVFYKVNLIDAYENPIFPNQKYSWINMWSLDFFGDYFNALKSKQRGVDTELKLNRISLFGSLIFVVWYFFCLFKTLKRKIFTYDNLFSIFFFAIFFEQIAYCHVVFNPDVASSFDMRYWVFYIFFLIYPLSKYMDKITNRKLINFHWMIVIFWCGFSLNQLLLIIT